MAKLVLVCTRTLADNRFTREDYLKLSERLIPDHIKPRSPYLIADKGLTIALFNPPQTIQVNNTSVCLGKLIAPGHKWWQPGSEIPDGSFAIFRTNPQKIELLTDFLASRTIWFIKTEDIFIASTSQRAIIYFLRSFVPNRETFSWMLASGNLGPGLSWDQRVKSLKCNACLILDRKSWEIQINHRHLVFKGRAASDQEHQEQLTGIINEVIEHIPLEPNQWILPLSGGYDSRTLLALLKDRKDIRSVTWGLQSSLRDPNSDAYLARKLAGYFGLDHEFLPTDIKETDIAKLFERFLTAGEGRVDHISGYMDGFMIWKKFFESNCDGIIRGDQGFGWQDIKNKNVIRHSLEFDFLQDYVNLHGMERLGFPRQVFPAFLRQRRGESLQAWRDRLFLEFRVPTVKAALSDLKLAYVEVISPFLTKAVIQKVLELPDDLRTNKVLFKKIVARLSPPVEFAKSMSIAAIESILQEPRILAYLLGELDSDCARALLSATLIERILPHLKPETSQTRQDGSGIRALNILTSKLQHYALRLTSKKIMDYRRLALRAFIILRMNKILKEDSRVLKS